MFWLIYLALIYKKEFPDYSAARKYEKYLKSGREREFLDKLESGQSPPDQTGG